jgi:hypothetical protein
MFVEELSDSCGRNRKSGVCLNDTGFGVMAKKDKQCLFVTMSVHIEIPLHREIDHPLDPFGFDGLAVDVEFADAAVIAAGVHLPFP